MNSQHRLVAILLGYFVVAAAPALADRPGTPTDVKVVAKSPTTVHVSFLNTADTDESVRFEVEQETNGERISPEAEARLSEQFGYTGTGSSSYSYRRWGRLVTGLDSETRYCFRVWSRITRYQSDADTRSEHPSAFACATTPSNPPLAPLDVKVQLASDLDKTPGISWNTPDQSGHRKIMKFVVERQSPPGANRPWILDAEVPGPAGQQTASTRLAFALEGSQVDPYGKHVYRVCAENSGGRDPTNGVDSTNRTCANPISLTPPRTLVQPANAGVLDRPQLEAAPKPASTQAVTAHVAVTAAAEASEASVRVLPKKVPPTPERESTGNSQIDPAGPVVLNPQPLPPKATATATRGETTSGSQQQSKVDPSGPVTLNPQPLPPKATQLAQRGQTVIVNQQTTRQGAGSLAGIKIDEASRARGQLSKKVEPPPEPVIPRPEPAHLTQPTGASSGASAAAVGPPSRAAQPILGTHRATGDLPGTAKILCRGGKSMRLEPMSQEMARALGRDPGGTTYNLFFGTTEGTVDADGNGLHAGTCAFLGQPWKSGDPPGIRFDTDPGGAFFNNQPPPAAAEETESRPYYLDRPDHYWLFTVKPAHGFYEAVSHDVWKPAVGPKAAATGGAIQAKPSTVPKGAAASPEERAKQGTAGAAQKPSDLFDMDDRAIIIVGGKQTTAGALKKEIDAQERTARSAKRVTAVAPKTPPPASAISQSPGEVALQTGAASTSMTTAPLAKATVLNPTPVVTAQPQATRAAVSTPLSSQPLQQATIPQGVASNLKMDCETREPRVHIIRGRISSAQQFTVEGACLGNYGGSLELIGQFPGGTLKPAIVLWGASAIVASIPKLYGVPDHAVALSVVRAPDQKRSDAKRFDYVAEREIVQILAGNFSPSPHYKNEYSDWTRDTTRRILKRTPAPAVFEVRKHPACALDSMSAVAQVGQVSSIDGSDPVPMDPARITVKWDWHCKYTFTERAKVERVLGIAEDIRSDTSCNAAFDVQAWASCPVGIAP